MYKKLQRRMKKLLRKFARIVQKNEGTPKGTYISYRRLNNRELVKKAIEGGKLCVNKDIDIVLKKIANAIEAIDKVK